MMAIVDRSTMLDLCASSMTSSRESFELFRMRTCCFAVPVLTSSPVDVRAESSRLVLLDIICCRRCDASGWRRCHKRRQHTNRSTRVAAEADTTATMMYSSVRSFSSCSGCCGSMFAAARLVSMHERLTVVSHSTSSCSPPIEVLNRTSTHTVYTSSLLTSAMTKLVTSGASVSLDRCTLSLSAK